jgi:hypothetical protein
MNKERVNALEADGVLTNEGAKALTPPDGWKCGGEFLPYHPQASHINPEHRDGWNECYKMAARNKALTPPDGWAEAVGLAGQILELRKAAPVGRMLGVFKLSKAILDMNAAIKGEAE